MPWQLMVIHGIRVTEAFGFGSLGLSADDSLVRDQVVQLGSEPIGIALLTGLDGCAVQRMPHAPCASRSAE
jgi:hypothetical protein